MKIELKKSDLKSVDGGAVAIEAGVLSRVVAINVGHHFQAAKTELASLPVDQIIRIPVDLVKVKYLEEKKVELVVVDPEKFATFILNRK